MSAITDFDFLIGQWSVRHRRLTERLTGCTTWIEFIGTASVRKILGGLGNFDEYTMPLPEGPFVGATLRLFDPSTGLWTINWMDSRRPGRLDPPMVGRFEHDQGSLLGRRLTRGNAGAGALCLVTALVRYLPLGAGVFDRSRAHMGNQLDDGFHPSRCDNT